MLNFIDNFLNDITMYRLLLYYLILLILVSIGLSFFSLLSFGPFALIVSTIYFIIACWCTNKVFSNVFETPTNIESVYISALILALIVSPMRDRHDLILFGWIAVWTMASKYIFAINKKHIFNPAAFGVAIVSFFGLGSATWWIGNIYLLPYVLIGGALIVRKIRRFDLVFYFFIFALIVSIIPSVTKGDDIVPILLKSFTETPLLFFAFIMLTEPLTTPPTKKLQGVYGAITGILVSPQFRLASFYTTPEIALLIGNIFSYLISPKGKVILSLKEKIQLSHNIYDFVFTKPHNVLFTPGQYMEWTLGFPNPDARGNRRYFTLASSPTEDNIRLGVRFYEKPSSFKSSLVGMNVGTKIMAGNLSGEFTLPKDKNEKLVFIAGGIGVTPFRSIIKYLLDTNERRDIVFIYINKVQKDIVYQDVFKVAEEKFGMKIINILTEETPADWKGLIGHLNTEIITKNIPDYLERTFYMSGSHIMVDSTKKIITDLGIRKEKIKTDYFPGL